MPLGAKKAVCGNEVKVAKAPLLACLTCPLCGQLFQEATTICECLHTFCRECIYSRLNDGETTGCPMCNVNLGCLPLEKLRADHQLDDVKAKLFPDNIRKRKSSAIVSPPTHNVGKRKERSLYSLGIGSVPSNPGFATRKTKWSPSTSANVESSSSTEKSEGQDDERQGHSQVGNQLDEDLGCSTSKRKSGGEGDSGSRFQKPEIASTSPPGMPGGWGTPSPILEVQHGPGRLHPGPRSSVSARNGRKVDQTASPGCEQVHLFSAMESLHSRGHTRTESVSYMAEDDGGGVAGGEERDVSCPLTTLAEVAGAHAARSTAGQGSKHPAASVSPVVLASTSMELCAGTARMRDDLVNHGTEAKSKGVVAAASSCMNGGSGAGAHRVGPNGRRNPNAWACHKDASKRSATLKSSSSGFVGPCTVPCRRNVGGIWMGESVLPQISSRYLRIRDGRLPVSLVKKYLVKKLGLKNDSEVEITCRGQPVVPSLPLDSVRNIWFATSGSVAASSCEGKVKGRSDSALAMEFSFPRDYLMVLTYQKHRRARIC